jgi:O-methyltransferase involved in polyketide biosynthesis
MTQADALRLPKTALITLCFRANEARRPDGIIEDPMATRLMNTIDYDFAWLNRSTRQDLALRALAFDNNTHRYLTCNPKATVVALGEGLQTSFWRLDAADLGDEFHWMTVDLAPIIELRKRLLPQSPRISMYAQSALDFSWMDRVNAENGVFITAEGLLPYLQPEQAVGLIRECARRFPGGQMMFDLPPKFQSVLARRRMWTMLHGGWPPTPFSLSASEIADLADTVPGILAAHNLPLPRGRGPVFDLLLTRTQHLPVCHRVRQLVGIVWPTVAQLILLEFGS